MMNVEISRLFNEAAIKKEVGNSLVVQRFGLRAFTAEGPDSICGRVTKILKSVQWKERREREGGRQRQRKRKKEVPRSSFIFFFFSFIFISWRLITSQHCSGFGHTLTWISHGFTYVPHPDPPSHLPLHPIPLGLPSAPGPSTCLMHPTWAGEKERSTQVLRAQLKRFPKETSSLFLHLIRHDKSRTNWP